jgi:hypothetical protein
MDFFTQPEVKKIIFNPDSLTCPETFSGLFAFFLTSGFSSLGAFPASFFVSFRD